MVKLKHLAILGCTGSVGQSALAVVDQHTDKLGIVGLAAGSNVDRFSSQIVKYEPAVVSLGSRDALVELKRKGLPESIVAGCGDEGLIDVVTHPSVDLVLCASSGVTALSAVLAAIQAGKTIALANKERDVPEYLQVDEKNRKVKFVRTPKFEEVPYPVVMEPNLVIEYYSR